MARCSAKQAGLLHKAANGGLDLFIIDFRYRGTRDKYEAAAGRYLRQERSYGLPESAFCPITGNGVAYLLPNGESYLLLRSLSR